ncbi:MAG: hypothetical protein LC808_14170 [Actinobacteria bacterium]|nr:hypothetical protein [Actinomycetota bacterium]
MTELPSNDGKKISRGDALSKFDAIGFAGLCLATAIAMAQKPWYVIVPLGVFCLFFLGILARRKKWRTLMLITLLVLVAVSSFFAGNLNDQNSEDSMNASLVSYGDSNTSVTSDQVIVPLQFTLRGSVHHPDKQHDLWVLVAHEWQCNNVVVGRKGQDANSRWDILVVRTTKERTTEWKEQYLFRRNFDIPQLPNDVIRLDSKSVIRR